MAKSSFLADKEDVDTFSDGACASITTGILNKNENIIQASNSESWPVIDATPLGTVILQSHPVKEEGAAYYLNKIEVGESNIYGGVDTNLAVKGEVVVGELSPHESYGTSSNKIMSVNPIAVPVDPTNVTPAIPILGFNNPGYSFMLGRQGPMLVQNPFFSSNSSPRHLEWNTGGMRLNSPTFTLLQALAVSGQHNADSSSLASFYPNTPSPSFPSHGSGGIYTKVDNSNSNAFAGVGDFVSAIKLDDQQKALEIAASNLMGMSSQNLNPVDYNGSARLLHHTLDSHSRGGSFDTSSLSGGEDAAYNFNELLAKRKIVDEGVIGFRCSFEGCDYRTQHKANIRTHFRTHTKERPYKCRFEGCSFTSSQVGNRNMHERIHTGVKPHVCDFPGCTYSSAKGSNLRAHKQRMHSETEDVI
jgi:hypothetical protein